MLPKDVAAWLREHLSYGHVALFLGAGFSVDARNKFGNPLPDARRLAELLWSFLDYPGAYDGTDLGILYQAALSSRKGQTALQEFMQSHLFPTTVPDWYTRVADFSWAYVFTTNVDAVVEIAWGRRLGAKIRIYYAPQDDYRERDPFLGATTYVKLHGCITKGVTRITFSPRQYAKRAAISDPWYDHFVRVYATTPTIFVGTSLNEPLFWQYLEVRQSRGHGAENRPRCLLVTPTISPARLDALRDLNVYPVSANASDFFEWLSSEMPDLKDQALVRRNIAVRLGVEELITRIASAPDKRAHLEQFYLALRPVTVPTSKLGYRSFFLLGSEPTWDDIGADLDADRDATPGLHDAVREYLAAPSGDAIILVGTAGSGKTTILKRLSVRLVNEGIPVYYCDGDEIPGRDAVKAFVELSERRCVFVFDNMHRYSGAAADWAETTRGVRFPPLFLGATRPNQYQRRAPDFQRLQGCRTVDLPHLSDTEIPRIIEKLGQHNLLGNLRGMTSTQRIEAFQRIAWKQLLIAMREATQGKGFDEIIRDEYDSLGNEDVQRIFLIVAVPSALQYSIRRTELVSASRVEPARLLRILNDELRGLVVPVDPDDERLRVRHPLIADLIVREVAPRGLLADAYVGYLSTLVNSIDRSRGTRDRAFRIYASLINHRHVYARFDGSVEYGRRIYGELEAHASGDGHFWLQYGSLELLYGDLDLAENLLLQAQALMEGDDLTETALGHLYLRKACKAGSLEEAIRLRERGETILAPLIGKRATFDPVVLHVRGSQMLGWLRSWGAMLPGDTLREQLRELQKFVRQAHDRHRSVEELRQLDDDVTREMLMTATRTEGTVQ